MQVEGEKVVEDLLVVVGPWVVGMKGRAYAGWEEGDWEGVDHREQVEGGRQKLLLWEVLEYMVKCKELPGTGLEYQEEEGTGMDWVYKVQGVEGKQQYL